MSTFLQLLKTLFLGLAVVVAAGVFLAMGYAMWMMKDYMSNMSGFMSSMQDSMVAMSEDMQEMRIAMVNMGGTPAQVQASGLSPRSAGGSALAKAGGAFYASVPEMTAANETCKAFLDSLDAGAGANLAKAEIDSVKTSVLAEESHMASMARDMREMDAHMFCMYLSMSADMTAMRNAMSAMTPSIASMGPAMHYMGHDMNRGVNSFTNPMSYMFNSFR